MWNLCYVMIYYYDRDLQWYFNRKRISFPCLSKAREWLNDHYSEKEGCLFLDYFGYTRAKEINHKYVIYIELELY